MTNSTDPLAGSLVDAIVNGQPADLPIPADPEPMISTSIRLPVDLLGWAKAEAARRDLPSWSALVRQLLESEQASIDSDAVVSVAQLQQVLHKLARNPAA